MIMSQFFPLLVIVVSSIPDQDTQVVEPPLLLGAMFPVRVLPYHPNPSSFYSVIFSCAPHASWWNSCRRLARFGSCNHKLGMLWSRFVLWWPTIAMPCRLNTIQYKTLLRYPAFAPKIRNCLTVSPALWHRDLDVETIHPLLLCPCLANSLTTVLVSPNHRVSRCFCFWIPERILPPNLPYTLLRIASPVLLDLDPSHASWILLDGIQVPRHSGLSSRNLSSVHLWSLCLVP